MYPFFCLKALMTSATYFYTNSFVSYCTSWIRKKNKVFIRSILYIRYLCFISLWTNNLDNSLYGWHYYIMKKNHSSQTTHTSFKNPVMEDSTAWTHVQINYLYQTHKSIIFFIRKYVFNTWYLVIIWRQPVRTVEVPALSPVGHQWRVCMEHM